jgi:hypothetical protein
MGGAYPYMDLNAKYGKLLLRFYYDRTSGAGDGDGCFLCSLTVLVSFNGDKKQREISILMHDNLSMVYS